MAKFVNSCDRVSKYGFDEMSKKVNLGVPRPKVSGKSGSIDSADKRGEGKACLK